MACEAIVACQACQRGVVIEIAASPIMLMFMHDRHILMGP
jgi:hypothetical protein